MASSTAQAYAERAVEASPPERTLQLVNDPPAERRTREPRPIGPILADYLADLAERAGAITNASPSIRRAR